MRIDRTFKQGDSVQIIDPENPLYGSLGTVFRLKDKKCHVRFDDGQILEFSLHDIGPILDYQTHKTLYRSHLIQLQLLAVDIGDRTWFEEIKGIIIKLDYLP